MDISEGLKELVRFSAIKLNRKKEGFVFLGKKSKEGRFDRKVVVSGKISTV